MCAYFLAPQRMPELSQDLGGIKMAPLSADSPSFTPLINSTHLTNSNHLPQTQPIPIPKKKKKSKKSERHRNADFVEVTNPDKHNASYSQSTIAESTIAVPHNLNTPTHVTRLPHTHTKALEAHAQMILVNLPFPPLPVVGGAGTEAREAILSGHDLLTSAVCVSLSTPQNLSLAAAQNIQQMKMAIVSKLFVDIRKSPTTDAAYQTYCAAFRQYMSLYPGSPDLRFWPMQHVDGANNIIEQGRQHIVAQSVVISDIDEVASKELHITTYTDMIKAYVQGMQMLNDT